MRLNDDCVSRKHAVGRETIGAHEAACEGSGQLPVASKARAHAPAGLSDSKTTLSRKIQDAGQSHEQKKQRLEERGEERNDVSWHCEEDEYSDTSRLNWASRLADYCSNPDRAPARSLFTQDEHPDRAPTQDEDEDEDEGEGEGEGEVDSS